MNKKKTLYIILAVVALVLVAVIILAASKLNGTPASGNSTETTGSSQTQPSEEIKSVTDINFDDLLP